MLKSRSASFVAGMLAGVLLMIAVRFALPQWEVKVLHTQNDKKSHHTVIRVNAYSGEVEQLFTTDPK